MNATSNFILSAMASGRSYDQALADATEAGLAERGVEADVGGSDAVAKVMILAALVFGRQLRSDDVACRGIDEVDPAEIERAVAAEGRIRPLATLEFSEPEGAGAVRASVEPAGGLLSVGPAHTLVVYGATARGDAALRALAGLGAERCGRLTVVTPPAVSSCSRTCATSISARSAGSATATAFPTGSP